MNHNRNIKISTAGSRRSTYWPGCELTWAEFAEKLKTPIRSKETMQEYLAMTKGAQSDLKDVGGFVGGTFTNDRRKAKNVIGRDLITLDLDNIPAGKTEDILKRVAGLSCASVVYSTRKHSGYAPRLRVVVPLDETAAADQYEPAARKIASLIGMEYCDPTTFDVCRLMYWPSCCCDGEYVYEVNDNPFCSLSGVLAMYGDYNDISQWPQVPGAETILKKRLLRQEDPHKKDGLVGAFCRTYSITQAMDKYIPGAYEETDIPGRYTYLGGTTAGGAILYDGDKFLYSHHATDPCSGQLVNAFDMVRLHLFGDRDDDAKEGTPSTRMPSFVAMKELAKADEEVATRMLTERMDGAKEAFATTEEGGLNNDDNLDWTKKLAKSKNGQIEKTINNVVLILRHDRLLKDKFAVDEFSSCGMVMGKVPWNKKPEKRRWTDVDYAGIYQYLELMYGITGKDKIDNALLLVSNENRFNDVKTYLEGLHWDGNKRLNTLLSDYLGAENNAYTQAVIRKALCAAVARAVEGGVKYDCMPIFTGPQGIGKSTFLAVLGKDWFSDSLTTFEGKEAAELIQGTWFVEVGELTAMSKQETNAVKQFLSKTHDIYRAAYGKTTNKYPRRCVFFGTSNDSEFLKDTTGNRRFWPVDVGVLPAAKSVWKDLPRELDQIWAEAYAYWTLGEELYMPKELEELAQEQQESHRESHAKEGLVREFLEREIPSDWDKWDVPTRRMYWSGNAHLREGTVLMPRDKVCAAEIWQECFGGDIKYLKRTDTSEINGILQGIKGWKRNKQGRRYGPYGSQRGFERV